MDPGEGIRRVLVQSTGTTICLQEEYFNPLSGQHLDLRHSVIILHLALFKWWRCRNWSENRSSQHCVLFCWYYDDDFYSYRHTTYSYDAHNLRIIMGGIDVPSSVNKSPRCCHHLHPQSSPLFPWVLEKLNLIATSLIDLLENFPVSAITLCSETRLNHFDTETWNYLLLIIFQFNYFEGWISSFYSASSIPVIYTFFKVVKKPP